MPGIVAFRRRWSVGSDDLVVPAVFLVILHSAWIFVLALIRGLIDFDDRYDCTVDLRDHIFGYIIILGVCVVMEIAVAWVSLRGTILSPEPRRYMEYLLYVRLGLGFVELAWLIVGAVWSGRHYTTCRPETAKKALLGIMICNWLMMLCCVISVWCTYDTAGAKWVKMKKYQDSMKDRRRANRRQSGSRRNWRQRSRLIREFFLKRFERKAFRAYEESWDRRLQLLCCCVERKGRNKNSMSEIAQLFTEFFRDLDVVPTDIVAGLVLLRHHQKHRMKTIIAQGTNDVYQYLSGVPVTPNTQFLQLTQPEVMGEFIKVIHYMRYALAAYGWPVYVMMNPCTWLCRLLPSLNCCCCCCHSSRSAATVVDDNCCGCNVASLKSISGLQDLDIVYATYHVDIGETPFFVALDHEFGKVVVCVRGTLSLQDVLTDLKAEPETLPLTPPRDDWQGHKGMVQAAVYIKKKLIEDKILDMAWERDEGRDIAKYDLVCVGHSLGAGTATILAILLKAEYPTLHCYAFSPPGGLLTLNCVEETKSYITSVVVGKDVVPRIGLPQLEMLRTDIINLIKSSQKSKWNIISKGFCCCSNERFFDDGNLDVERDATAHPSNSAIGLSAHVPLYPPGKMIHVVRSHVSRKGGCKSAEPIYQAIWATNGDFDEVLVSPTMVNDHMPDNVLDSLEKVLQRAGPQKPVRTMTDAEPHAFFSQLSESSSATPSPSQAQGFLETSFTGGVVLRQQPTGGPERDKLARSWDHAAEQILRSQEGGRVGSANPSAHNSTGSLVRPYYTLPLTSQRVQAPLASPETLSMASGIVGGSVASGITGSMASGVASGLTQSESIRDSLRRSFHSPPSHSSLRHSLSGPPARIDGVHVELSPGKGRPESTANREAVDGEKGTTKPRGHSLHGMGNTKPNQNVAPTKHVLSAEDMSAKDTVLSNGAPGTTPHYSAGVENRTSVEPESVYDSQSECKQTDPSVLPSNVPTKALGGQSNNPDGLKDSGVMSDRETTQAKSSPATSVKAQDNPVVLAFGNRDGERIASLEACMRHSPVETTQGEYEHPNLHYSQASTGYPHGAYHPPIRYGSGEVDLGITSKEADMKVINKYTSPVSGHRIEPLVHKPTQNHPTSKTATPSVDLTGNSKPVVSTSTNPHPHPFVHCQSESSIFAKHFPPKLGMKRSAERSDICHLEDETEVFPPPKDLFTIKRSGEHTDITNLGSDLDVFEEETEDTVGKLTVSRGRLPATQNTPRSSAVGSIGQRQEAGSRHASSSHSSRSDDVFESEMAVEMPSETDV
ncbi:diacylglycerol lipase-alpha-like isoform X2 [Babylonia areolata]|uniref:diacylglycerol lipase-alpha-like isoform X2 n=1 Tax=Babylonia areolata TaxID=304850 RepID=UPI003FD1E5DC